MFLFLDNKVINTSGKSFVLFENSFIHKFNSIKSGSVFWFNKLLITIGTLFILLGQLIKETIIFKFLKYLQQKFLL